MFSFVRHFFDHKFPALYFMLCRPVASSKSARICRACFHSPGQWLRLVLFPAECQNKGSAFISRVLFCFAFASVIFYVIGFSCQLTIFVFVCLKTHSYSSAQNFKTKRCCLGRTDRGREKVACFRQFSFS